MSGWRGIVAGLMMCVTACSSSDDKQESACPVVGTYTMTGIIESSSPGCADVADAGVDIAPSSLAVTITQKPAGATGSEFAIELQGATGACGADLVGGCKLQAKCLIRLTDALDPANATATLQVSWLFNEQGFTGVNANTTPPAQSLPRGCSLTANVTGVRR